MSDPYIGSQPSRPSVGLPGLSKPAGSKPAEAPKTQAPPTSPPPSSQEPKQRLTSFLNKLETTWQLFNRGTRESDEGALPKGKTAYLEDSALPSQDSLKELRARAAKGSTEFSGAKPSERSNPAQPQQTKSSPSQGSKETSGKPESKPASGTESSASKRGLPTPSQGSQATPLPRQSAGWQPSGFASSRSFLATAQMAGAQLRTSDASGRPGAPAQAEALARQPVFSQSLAQVNQRVTNRHVSSHMPVHNAFLDEHHESKSGTASPLRLFWAGAKPSASSKNPFAGQPRLSLASGQSQGGQTQSLGSHLSLHSSALASARADIASRFAGKAIHSLLKKLYDEEDLEELDEEEAVSGLGLILRLGGEFTYDHSTRVLDLALELADEVGIQDKTTRKEIKYGAVLCDIGEFDLLLQSGDESEKKTSQLESFLGGQDMLRAGLLHDIGKVNIPPEILYKPGKLTPEEYELMKMHPIYGEEIVRPIASLRYLCPTIRGHHERWDGKGYPDGLAADSIPIAARIISVADVFDALSAERPYKRGMEVAKVKGILAEGRGTHFDPTLVDSFLRIIDRRYPLDLESSSEPDRLTEVSSDTEDEP